MKIYIGADFVPTDINHELFRDGKITSLIGEELYAVLRQADLNIFNLEVPLTDSSTPIEKFGANLMSPPYTIAGFDKLKPLYFTLANNHSLDQGGEGLQSTINLLDAHQIHHSGAGANLEEACMPFIFEQEGKRVGIYACSENEFTIATKEEPGANPFNPLESFDHVAALKATCDFVIVLYHGGKEFYRYPSPMLQRYCRKFVEKGADLVVTQHSHCIGCREDYEGKTIIYGQGNFLFHSAFFERLECFVHESILLEVTITDSMDVKEIPFVKTNDFVGIRLATVDECDLTLGAYKKRSSEILQKGFIESKYSDFAEQHISRYLREFLGRNKVTKVLNGLCNRKLSSFLLDKVGYLAIQNYLECEAHQELFLQGIKNRTKK